MNFTWGSYLIMFTVGIGLIINGILGLKNRKKRAKTLQKYFLGLVSEPVCENMFFVIGPFYFIIGLVLFIIGLTGLLMGN